MQISVSLYQTSLKFPLLFYRLDTLGTADKIFSRGDTYCLKHSKVNEVSWMFCLELLITMYSAAGVHPKGVCQVAATPTPPPPPHKKKKKFKKKKYYILL